MSRLIPKMPDELTPEQRAQYDRMARSRTARADGQLGGPFDPWVRSAELAQRAISFGNFIWERTTLDRKIVELAIAVTAKYWQSNVEWTAHAPRAVQYGVAEAVIAAVLAGQRPTDAPEDELVTIDVCRTINETRRLPKELYDRAVATFGEQGLVEMMATTGYYTLVAMTLAAFDVQPAAGVARPFPE